MISFNSFVRGLGYKLHYYQQNVIDQWRISGDDKSLVLMSRQMGKSLLGMIYGLYVASIESTNVCLVYHCERRTSDCWKQVADMIDDTLVQYLVKSVEKNRINFVNGASIIFATPNNIERSLVGFRNTFGEFILDEAAFLDHPVLQKLMDFCYHYKRTNNSVNIKILTTPASKRAFENWEAVPSIVYEIYRNNLLGTDKTWNVIRKDIDSCPDCYNSSNIKQSIGSESFQQEYLCHFY